MRQIILESQQDHMEPTCPYCATLATVAEGIGADEIGADDGVDVGLAGGADDGVAVGLGVLGGGA